MFPVVDLEDTIVALATPPGAGAIGVIRVSGEKAITLCNRFFKGKDLTQQATHTIHFGIIHDGGATIDEVLVSVFLSPHSYTRQNVVEISCHGSPYIQQQILRLFMRSGARLAKPGEFTLRAFLNGKMDLSQAEAVGDLIAASSSSAHAIALQQMRGGFSHQIRQLREQLIHFASLIELELDFAEEDVEFANRQQLVDLVTHIQEIIQSLLDSFRLGNVIKNGVATVIAGRPNAGKSTLLNVLLNEERAIVSEIPGTTRDTIEEVINIEGILFRLIDTAGIREATDAIEAIGIERTFEKIRQSTLILYLFDIQEISQETLANDLQLLKQKNVNVLPVGNKIDKDVLKAYQQKFRSLTDVFFISTKEKTNMEELKKKLVTAALGSQINLEGTIVSSARHWEALDKSYRAITDVIQGLQHATSKELLALDIKKALYHLGEITGEISSEELLSNIFSRFCIGK